MVAVEFGFLSYLVWGGGEGMNWSKQNYCIVLYYIFIAPNCFWRRTSLCLGESVVQARLGEMLGLASYS